MTHHRSLRVTFLNPADDGDAFFATLVSFMRRAAHDLGVELEVVDCHRSPATLREQARALLGRPVPPSYLLLVNEQGLAVEVLPRAHARGVKTLLVNEGLMVPDRQVLGDPGERYTSWLGELVPDDREAGHLLATSLIAEARRLRRGGDGEVVLVALGGSFTSSSLLRINGLRQAVAESAGVTLREVVPANWDGERARQETARLLDRHPDLVAIWAASDHMALAAAEAAAARGRIPGVDLVVGGIDWAPFAFDKVREGVLAATVGGHFLDGAWALVLLHDHHHATSAGAPAARQVRSRLALVSRDNVDAYERVFARRDTVDFRRFSRVVNPGLAGYSFTVDAVL